MKCCRCDHGTLIPSFMDSLFRAHTCQSCEGHWILLEDFLAWKEGHPDFSFAEDVQYQEDLEESSKALLCPVTGSIMTKFRISSHTQHRIDYSGNIGGIWLDKGEWELLKQEGLAGSLNVLVTRLWQNKVRAENTKDNFAQMYEDKFGSAIYAQAKELRTWLQAQPQKADLRAYIFAEDPYSAK